MFQFRNRKTNSRNTNERTLADHVIKQGAEDDTWAQETGRKGRMYKTCLMTSFKTCTSHQI
jgi:hypothetical protein